jgi:hypothetical protein
MNLKQNQLFANGKRRQSLNCLFSDLRLAGEIRSSMQIFPLRPTIFLLGGVYEPDEHHEYLTDLTAEMAVVRSAVESNDLLCSFCF